MFEELVELAALPLWLVALGTGDTVKAALQRVLREVQSPDVAVLSCEPDRLRLTEDGLSGGYVVTYAEAMDATPQAVRLRGRLVSDPKPAARAQSPPFGSPGWTATLPKLRLSLETEQAARDLPSLPTLTDPEAAADLLQRAIGSAGPAYEGYRLLACSPQIVRHKHGSRCTVRYRLAYSDEFATRGWPDVVVAKAYRGDKGLAAWMGMQELWQSAVMRSGVTLAEPLAYLPESKVLLQGAVPGDHTLKDSIRAAIAAGDARSIEAVRATMRATAAGLAALHQSGIQHGSVVTWNDELTEIRSLIAGLAVHAPEVEHATSRLLARLEALADDATPDECLPAHGSFRPDQVLLDGQGIGFIDFDGFCQAEPAQDLALFGSTVRRLSARQSHRAHLDRFAQDFMDEYASRAQVSPLRVALWESLALVAPVLHAWTKVKPDKAPSAFAVLRDHLDTGWLLRSR